MTYDEEDGFYKEAALDISNNKVIPTETIFNFTQNIPRKGALEILPKIYDIAVPYQDASLAAFTLENLLKYNAPVIEIGKKRDGYLPVRLYD